MKQRFVLLIAIYKTTQRRCCNAVTRELAQTEYLVIILPITTWRECSHCHDKITKFTKSYFTSSLLILFEKYLHFYCFCLLNSSTLWVKKTRHNSLVCNLAKCLPIFKILSLLDLAVNVHLGQCWTDRVNTSMFRQKQQFLKRNDIGSITDETSDLPWMASVPFIA